MSLALEIDQARPREEAPPPLTRQPLFVRYWIGQTISVFGDQISALAIPLTAILALDASALQVGILASLAWLPHLLFSLPAGVWIDRRANRRRNMIVADVLRAAALATIPRRLVARRADDLAAASRSPSPSARSPCSSTSPAPRSSSRWSTARSTSMRTASSRRPARSRTSPGRPTAGLLVQVLTAPVAIAADALSFVASAIALRGVEGCGARGRAERVERATGSPEGFRYLAQRQGAARQRRAARARSTSSASSSSRSSSSTRAARSASAPARSGSSSARPRSARSQAP